MQPLILHLCFKEWLNIGGIALFFSLLLSSMCYFLVNAPWHDGLLFGLLLGACLFVCAYAFTTVLNQKVLPKLLQTYWLLCAGLFSFFAGFIATLLTCVLSTFLHVILLEKFETHLWLFAFMIGILSYAVAFLLYQFACIRYEKESQKSLLIQSRLKSLERQLNPHFLFNALNSMSELLHVNPLKAEEALLELSHFLRSSMQERSLITLHEELENARRYLNLENLRFDGKIDLHLRVDEALQTECIPKFSIQLLIENAIKHGFENKPLTIKIEGYKDAALHLIIKNNGKAMQTSLFGIGLHNLQERLELLSKGSLHLRALNPPTFEIILGERV